MTVVSLFSFIFCCMVVCRKIVSKDDIHTFGNNFPIPIDQQISIFKKNIAPNIEYLGCGYDIFSGSSIDEKSSFNVNNYRSPILDSYSLGNVFGDTTENFGMWIRNEFMCDISTEETTIDSEEKLIKTLETNNEESGSNIWSSHFKKEVVKDDLLDTLKRYRKLTVKKYQCTVYSAGISDVKNGKNMRLFHKVVKDLVETCKGKLESSECPPNLYLKDPYNPKCSTCIMPFMKFFIDYGTHVTTKITMGGSIRKFMRKNNYESKNRKHYTKKRVEENKTFFKLINDRSESSDENSSKYNNSGDIEDLYTFTIGPEPSSLELSSHVLTEWMVSVSENPVPIKVELTSIEELIADNGHLEVIKSALEYYAKTKGKDATSTKMSYVENALSTLIREADTSVLVEEEVNNEVCSDGKRILYGFGVTFNSDGEVLQVKLCYSGLNACLLETAKNVSSSFVWATCHSSRQYNFQQKLVRGHPTTWKEVRCPGEMTVAFGIILNFKDKSGKITIKRCISGRNNCGATNLGQNGIIWIICVPPNLIDTKYIEVQTSYGYKILSNRCNERYKLANGLIFKKPGRDSNITIDKPGRESNIIIDKCANNLQNCDVRCSSCSSVASLIFCLI